MEIITTLSPEQDQVKHNWAFSEVWIDPYLSPPYILLLLGDNSGNCCIYDPAQQYKIVYTCQSYQEAENWLLEDEYEPVEGRLQQSIISPE